VVPRLGIVLAVPNRDPKARLDHSSIYPRLPPAPVQPQQCCIVRSTSISMEASASFHWADYLVFSIVLAASCLVGVYYWWKGRGKDISEFTIGGRNMHVIPVSLSLFVTRLTTLSYIGE
jgi:hypothetical protein